MLQVHGPKKINKNKEAKKNRQRPWEDISPKELHKWLINKRCLISLIIKNKQISTTLRYNYIPSKMATIKKKKKKQKSCRRCEENRTLYTPGGNI